MQVRILSMLYVLVVTLSLHAQKIPFTNYTVKNGLPSNVVSDIEQDHLGYMWFGTQAGAVRFDGYNFVTYDINSGLPGNDVKDILVDSKQHIWVGTRNNGIAVITTTGVKSITEADGLISNNVKFIFEDWQQKIWCITYQGISIIQHDTVINYNAGNCPIKDEVQTYYLSTNGTVFICSKDGLFTFNNEFHSFRKDQLGYLDVHDITEDRPKSFWIATQNKGVVHLLPDNSVEIFDQTRGLHTPFIHSLGVADSGVVIAGGYDGSLYALREGNEAQGYQKGFQNSVITSIRKDKKDRIWCQTLKSGIIHIDNNIPRLITKENNLTSDQLTKIFFDDSHNIWFATRSGISVYGKTLFEQYNTELLNNDRYILSIASSKDRVLFGSYSGLNILKNSGKLEYLSSESGFGLRPAIYSILNDDPMVLGRTGYISFLNNPPNQYSGNKIALPVEKQVSAFDLVKNNELIYVASDGGLFVLEGNNIVYKPNPDPNLNSLYSIAADTLGNIWCGSSNGLAIYDGRTYHNYSTANGLPDNFCNDITFDHKGTAWIATDNGITNAQLVHNWELHCSNYGTADGLTSGLTLLITEDRKNNIWIGHNKGLDKFNPKKQSFTYYGPSEGFLPIETNLGAVSHGQNGEIWFGTIDGAIRYLPENDYIYTDPPKSYITKIELYGDSISINELADSIHPVTNLPVNLSLRYDQNNLVFHFVGLHYSIVEKNSYRYMLEGYDSHWSEITHEISTPPYRKLSHGQYTFRVIAANCDGVWTPNPVEFSFTIRPPFWKTLGFYILESILGILLIWAIMYFRVRKLKADKALLTRKVKERTVEIEKQRDQIAHQKKEITDSIQYAERIQRAVLPRNSYVSKFLPEYFILFKPRDIVSGDFYWAHNDSDKIVIVAADCTGHGVPGAFMSMLGVSILNEISSGDELPPANEMLDMLREHLTQTLRQTGEEGEAKDGMDLSMVILDKTTRKVQFAGAYNPLIHIRNQEATVYKADKMPVGFHFGGMHPFTAHDIEVQQGDCLYMFSDGYADQFGGPEGKKFKSANLRKLLCELSTLPMEQQKEQLNTTIEEWMKDEEQIDDILLIGIRV